MLSKGKIGTNQTPLNHNVIPTPSMYNCSLVFLLAETKEWDTYRRYVWTFITLGVRITVVVTRHFFIQSSSYIEYQLYFDWHDLWQQSLIANSMITYCIRDASSFQPLFLILQLEIAIWQVLRAGFRRGRNARMSSVEAKVNYSIGSPISIRVCHRVLIQPQQFYNIVIPHHSKSHWIALNMLHSH